ncbi:hypothetical protein [Winogradskyella sp. PE311]|uniref:hypothetical protein n=1 Tax=Winogradskyella sp. PE311 TaxID=3366943 RepID=UPI00397F94EB
MRLTFLSLLTLIFFTSCGANKNSIPENDLNNNINNKYNKQYRNSVDGRFGKMGSATLGQFYEALGQNLNINIDTSKTILINYLQKGDNCIVRSGDEKYEKNVLKTYKNMSDRISKIYDTKNILVLTKNSYFSKYAEDNTDWLEDNNFIKNNIFTSNKNCSGFFILRTDGKFYKYYGEDYFSIVKKLLSAKEWDYPDKVLE